LSSRTICSSSRSITLRCLGMFTTGAECRIKNEESNQFRAIKMVKWVINNGRQ
jgi:hypothetical protein